MCKHKYPLVLLCPNHGINKGLTGIAASKLLYWLRDSNTAYRQESLKLRLHGFLRTTQPCAV